MTVLSDSELSSHLKKSKAALWSVGALGDPYALVLRGLDDSYPVYEKVRAYGPMSRSRLGTWVTADHGLAHELSRDRRFGVRFKDGRRVAPSVPQFDNSFVGMDAPDHNRLRRIAAPAFLPRVVEQYRAEVEKLCHDLIDQIDTSGEFDLMETFARQVPVNVIASLFGITEEMRPQFQRFCKGLTHTLDGNLTLPAARDLAESIEGMNALVGELIEERSARPAGDVISRIQKALDGDKLTTAEAVTICTMLSLGGSETTVNMIGSGILALLDTPGQWNCSRTTPRCRPRPSRSRCASTPPCRSRSGWPTRRWRSPGAPGRRRRGGHHQRRGQPRPGRLHRPEHLRHHPGEPGRPPGLLGRRPLLRGRAAGPAGGGRGVPRPGGAAAGAEAGRRGETP